jgi:hypothetical protein
MKNILFYITGHGYGHATRNIEILKKITELGGEYFCHIKTNAPEWLFNLNLSKNYRYNYLFHDIGVVQNDWITIDKETTLTAFSELWKDRRKIINRELKYIEKNNIDLIVADIPPLAFEIAQQAKVPGIAMGNFSWDWIYEPYVADLPKYNYIIPRIKEAYSQAQVLLRLPFAGDMSAFKEIKDIPLVGRRAKLSKAEVRDKLSPKIDSQKPLIIIALRSEDLDRINRQKLEQIPEFQFAVFEKKYAEFKNIAHFSSNFLPFQELVHAADAVISKLGYGIVSECIINRTPLIFTSRIDFREYEVLKQGLTEKGISQFIPLEDFLAGNWRDYLTFIKNQPFSWPEIENNGLEVTVAEIKKYLK